MQQKDQNQPQFAPVSELPSLGPFLKGMLSEAREQFANLQAARPKPYVLDDATVNRVLSVYGTQLDDLGLFDELLRRWGAETDLSSAQRAEIEQLKGVVAQVREQVTSILTLAEELKQGTIERILEINDADLGLQVFLGEIPG